MRSVVMIAVSGVLVLELSLTSISALLNLRVWRDRMRTLLRVQVGPPGRVVVVVFCVPTAGLIIYGFTDPRMGVASGAMCAAVAGGVVARQWHAGDRGTALGPYAFFCTCGLALAASAA